jgi:uncharacterized membrane-anchored protein
MNSESDETIVSAHLTGRTGGGASGSMRLRRAAMKVPEITVYFWIAKLLTTGMGEVTSDYLAHRLGPIPAVAIGAVGFAVALALQFSADRYVAWAYWLTVVMVAVFGTMAADGLHIELHIPYIVSAVFFAFGLLAVFCVWYAVEKTLSIHSIYTPRRELFYWATVMATFALGTAVGDLTATTWHLGYFSSALLFAGLMVIPAVLYWAFHVSEVFAFWFAYILTRPLGASVADWVAVPHSRGGLGLSYGVVSLVLSAAIIVVVGYLVVSKRDVPRDDALLPAR